MKTSDNAAMPVLNESFSLLGLAESSKKQLIALAGEVVRHTSEEGGDVLGLLALSSKLSLFAAEVEKQAKQAGLSELAPYGREAVCKSGVKLQTKETGVKYDYSGDPIWLRLNEAVEKATEARKQHEDLLKKLPYSGMGLTDPDTAETYHAHPPAKRASETIQTTIL